MSDYQSLLEREPIKLLAVGDSGSGKTGMLISLMRAGFNVRILEFDPNGLGILVQLLRKEPPSVQARLRAEKLYDKIGVVGNRVGLTAMPTAFLTAMNLVTVKWLDSGDKTDLGPVTSWGSGDVLVLDTLTFAGRASYNLTQHLNGGAAYTSPMWGEAMDRLLNLVMLITGADVKCHVVMNAHLKYQESEGTGITKAFPEALGKALPPQIMRFFNAAILCKSQRNGTTVTRKILTRPDGLVDTKFPVISAPPELDLDTGLAELFRLLGAKPNSPEPPAKPAAQQPTPSAPATATQPAAVAATGS